MKYTFNNPESGKQQTVNIDDQWIQKQSVLLGITKREAIMMWLSDEGYISNDTVQELTAKAQANKVGAKAQSDKPRKRPERKPDAEKRALINYLEDCMKNLVGGSSLVETSRSVREVGIVNPERIIAFTIGDDTYEITLSKKRKPKA